MYKLSAYSKLELPTWHEVYNVFYKDWYLNDANNPKWNELDPYWKITKHDYILSTVCNQINKMIHEDGQFADHELLRDALMVCTDDVDRHSKKLPIYHINHPKGYPDPFVIPRDNVYRIIVNDVKITNPWIILEDGTPIYMFEEGFEYMMEDMMEPFRNYFENGVGWKDESGGLLSQAVEMYGYKPGNYDPAL